MRQESGEYGQLEGVQSSCADSRNQEDGRAPVVSPVIGWIEHGDLAIISSGREAIERHAEVERSYTEPACSIGLYCNGWSLENLLVGKVEGYKGK